MRCAGTRELPAVVVLDPLPVPAVGAAGVCMRATVVTSGDVFTTTGCRALADMLLAVPGAASIIGAPFNGREASPEKP